MSNIVEQRTAATIAAEINIIKKQTQTILLTSAIEIGRRLVEAKEMVPHGEWGQWLQENVDYSTSTANNLMRIAKEFGDKQLSFFGGKDLQALGNISYTQAVALLGIPDYEREAFVKEHDIENMSTRELQKLVKEAQDRAQKAEQDVQRLLADNEAYKQDLEKARLEQERLEQKLQETSMNLTAAVTDGNLAEVQRLERELAQAGKELEKAKARAAELEQQLQEKPMEVSATEIVENIPDDVAKELEQLRAKAGQSEALAKFRVQFDTLTKGFNDILGTLDEIKGQSYEDYKKYQGAIVKLIDRMLEVLS